MLLFARHLAPLVRLNRQLLDDLRALTPRWQCKRHGHVPLHTLDGWLCERCGEEGVRPGHERCWP